MTRLSTRGGGRRPKSAKARSRGISLTLTRIDPGCAHIADPPTSRAPVDRRWASSRRAHSNVALGWPSVARVIVPVKTGLRPPPSAASVLTRDYHPAFVCHQEVDARDRWRARNRADGWVHFFEHKWVHFRERRGYGTRQSSECHGDSMLEAISMVDAAPARGDVHARMQVSPGECNGHRGAHTEFINSRLVN